jgi:hypothetical protein
LAILTIFLNLLGRVRRYDCTEMRFGPLEVPFADTRWYARPLDPRIAGERPMRNRRRIVTPAVLVSALLVPLLQTAPARAADDDDTSVAQTCIRHSQLRRTKVLGDRNIVFVTRNGSIFNNELPRQCPSMRRNALLNYAVDGGDMCAGDSFQVLWQVGTNYMPAFVCQLGMFAPISEDEMADLEALTEERSERKPRRRTERDMVQAERAALPAPAPAETASPAEPSPK